jgi:hypothetical protein
VEKKPAKVAESANFDKWWEVFPKNDTFDYKGMHFEGSRGMRVNEDRCRVAFDKIIAEGEHTAQNMIDALILDVTKRKEASVKEKSNKLKFLQNSLTYLLQRAYENYIDDAKAGVKVVESRVSRGATDI